MPLKQTQLILFWTPAFKGVTLYFIDVIPAKAEIQHLRQAKGSREPLAEFSIGPLKKNK